MIVEKLNTNRGRLALALVAFAALIALVATNPPAADAQGSAFCQQYPDHPSCLDEGGEGDDDDQGPGFGPGFGPGGAAGPGGDGSGAGELPFTGYPLTPLILLLLLLLLVGLTIRTYIAARDRLRKRAAVAGMPPLD